jgi:hypothetical protein
LGSLVALAFVVVAVGLAGHALSEALWLWEARRAAGPDAPPEVGSVVGPLERAASSAALSVAVLTAINWALALVHQLRLAPLAAACVAAGAAGALWLYRRRQASPPARVELPQQKTIFVLAVLAPTFLWIVYVLWRSLEVPVVSHDGINYHMPKAVMLMRAHGYEYFVTPNSRITTFPFDYELLLTDVLLVTGSDAATEWPMTFFYVVYALVAGALVERWWGRGLHVLAGVLVAASMPISVLHTGAHKNDLMGTSLAVAAAMWTARALVRREAAPAVLALVVGTLYAGTKFQGAAALACSVVVVALLGWKDRALAGRALRALGAKRWLALLALLVGCAVLLGGASYFGNLIHTGKIMGVNLEKVQTRGYGDLRPLYMFPYMALAVPFSSTDQDVWVPWLGQRWWWPSRDHVFSHCGVIVTVCALVLPFGVARYRRRVSAAGEPRVAGAIVVLSAAAMLIIRLHPLGMFNSSLRYVVFLPPFIVAWTLAPACRELLQGGVRTERLGYGLVAGLALGGAAYTYKYATNDFYLPMSYLDFVLEHPEARLVTTSAQRGENVVDEWAAPEDTIAIDGDVATYAYAAYGANLTRKIVYIPEGEGPAAIPDEAQWVVVDRGWNKTWAHPDWKDNSTLEYLMRGPLSPADTRVLRQLKKDPRFVLVYRNIRYNQAVFLRVGVDRPFGRSVFDDRPPEKPPERPRESPPERPQEKAQDKPPEAAPEGGPPR